MTTSSFSLKKSLSVKLGEKTFYKENVFQKTAMEDKRDTRKNKKQSTVKPVYNGHPWDLKKVAVLQRCMMKLRFRLAVDDSNWPLLTGGHCSQVVVKSGLTVHQKCRTHSTRVADKCET